MRKSITWMAGNHVAANLLMLVFIIGGLIIGVTIKQEVFPEIELDTIRISVSYPGAGPEEVEEGIVLKLEERLSGINGIEDIRSSAREGRASVRLDVLDGEDIDEVLQDVKSDRSGQAYNTARRSRKANSIKNCIQGRGHLRGRLRRR
jgi:multidrug efflux pump subunit AcrB